MMSYLFVGLREYGQGLETGVGLEREVVFRYMAQKNRVVRLIFFSFTNYSKMIMSGNSTIFSQFQSKRDSSQKKKFDSNLDFFSMGCHNDFHPDTCVNDFPTNQADIEICLNCEIFILKIPFCTHFFIS